MTKSSRTLDRQEVNEIGLKSIPHPLRRGYVTAKAHVCLCFAKRVIHHLGSSQSCRLVKSVNVFEKEKKGSCPFSSSKPRPKKGKKHLHCSCESAADLVSNDKSYFYNQDEWLQEIMNANQIQVKSSRLKRVQSALTFG